MARKTETSYEVRKRWKDKMYRSFQVNLRHDIDQELIDFIDANKSKMGTSQIFREALEMYIKANSEG